MTPSTAKVATLRTGQGIDSITLSNAPIPQPGAGEALVRLTAATLNFRDLIMAKGLIPGIAKEPELIPLSCAAGEVIAVGSDVTRVRVGDRVAPTFTLGWIDGPQRSMEMLGGSVDGVARQYAVFPDHSLCRVPDALGDMDAATLACAALTAWSALTAFRPTGVDDWVLAHGTGVAGAGNGHALELRRADGLGGRLEHGPGIHVAWRELLGCRPGGGQHRGDRARYCETSTHVVASSSRRSG